MSEDAVFRIRAELFSLMQEILDELVRWTGYATLRLLTFGLYCGGGTSDGVLEGAVGIVVVAGLLYLTYAFSFG